jgi:hypothetical protein
MSPTLFLPALLPSKQERLGRGEYNAATTRVLHFKFNPEAEMAREVRDARVAELESENEALKQHLQRLEAAATAAVQQQQQVGVPGRKGCWGRKQLQRCTPLCNVMLAGG